MLQTGSTTSLRVSSQISSRSAAKYWLRYWNNIDLYYSNNDIFSLHKRNKAFQYRAQYPEAKKTNMWDEWQVEQTKKWVAEVLAVFFFNSSLTTMFDLFLKVRDNVVTLKLSICFGVTYSI